MGATTGMGVIGDVRGLTMERDKVTRRVKR